MKHCPKVLWKTMDDVFNAIPETTKIIVFRGDFEDSTFLMERGYKNITLEKAEELMATPQKSPATTEPEPPFQWVVVL